MQQYFCMCIKKDIHSGSGEQKFPLSFIHSFPSCQSHNCFKCWNCGFKTKVIPKLMINWVKMVIMKTNWYTNFFFFNPGRLIADKHDKTEGFFNPRIKLTYFRSRWSNSQYVQGCRKIKNPGCGLASKNIISTDWEK